MPGWLDTFKDWVFGVEKSPPAPSSSLSGWAKLAAQQQAEYARANVSGTRASGSIKPAPRSSGNYSGGGGGSSWGPPPVSAPYKRGGGGGSSWGGPSDTTAPRWKDTRPHMEDEGWQGPAPRRESRWGTPNLNKYGLGPNPEQKAKTFPNRQFNPLAPSVEGTGEGTLLADAGTGLDFNPATMPVVGVGGGGGGATPASGVPTGPRNPLVDDDDRTGPLPNSDYSLDPTPTPRPDAPGTQRKNAGWEDRVAAVDPVTGAAIAVPKPSGPTRQLLENRDWTLPDAPPEPITPTHKVDLTNAKPLAEYTYDIDDAELTRILNTYTGEDGYVGPEKVAKTPFGPGGRRMTQDSYYENDTRTIESDVTHSVQMTWDEYNALNDDQRAAVDFTTEFLKAREADLSKSADQEAMPDYTERVEAMFGEGGGSQTYAPRTLELLEGVGFEAPGQDFDEFLSLDRLPTTDELMAGNFDKVDFETADLSDPEEVQAAVRSVANQALVDNALIQEAGAFLNEALQDEGVWNTSSAVTNALTGEPPGKVPVGFGNEGMRDWVEGRDPEFGMDEYFQTTYAGLSNPGADWQEVWTTAVENAEMPEQDVQKLLRYIDLRTRKEEQMGLLSDDLRTPEQIRALVGLED